MAGRAVIGLGMLIPAVLLLTACSGTGDPNRQGLLRTIGLRQPAPDEFLVVERKPLEMPGDFSALPEPAPEGINRTDPQPQAEVAALLGRAQAPLRTDGTVTPGEAALLTQANAAETDPALRETLAAEDQAAREEGSTYYGLSSLFGRSTNDPYKDQLLDAEAERIRLRAAGVQTPAAPPPVEEEPGSLF